MTLAELIAAKNRIVFFGGAGVSTESGIPDFRSSGGIYSEKYGSLPPEVIISRDFFFENTETFYGFYREKLIFPKAKPNKAHYALAKLEKTGKLSCVITQNIDGLHQAAGSRNVIELHGSVLRNSCLSCGKKYPLEAVTAADGIPRCEVCGGLIKPDVTLYGEALPQGAFEAAVSALKSADLLIIGGTSLSVYPAASLIGYYGGRDSVVINLSPTSADKAASLVINGKVGQTLDRALTELDYK